MPSLPSRGRLITFAVLLPAAVAGSNQLLFELAPSFHGPRVWLYPWMAFSTAVLSWCTGRYLSPAWLRCVVFAWSLVLLDMLTIAACLTRRTEMHFGHMMVAAQVSLMVLWAVLAIGNWQWRMPLGLVAAAGLIVFANAFRPYWGAPAWGVLMLLASVIILALSGTLRFSGFVLQRLAGDTSGWSSHHSLKTTQFGLKHMLIWATALVPILLVMRGLDFVVLKRLGGPGVFSFALVAMVIAVANLVAIWSVLGQGNSALRLALLLVIPYFLGAGTDVYLQFVEATYRTTRAFSGSLVRSIALPRESFVTWLCLNSALLAALLLFLRASGYRLIKNRR